MEGKMVEALREKEIAETMILSKNYMGARDTIHRARQLFPGLAIFSQILTVCDILCAADMWIPDYGTDWYLVLQLNPKANESTIQSQYRKLVTLLEPIRNKFSGTGSALKFIQDGFSVISDREKRLQFDLERDASRWACGSVSDLGVMNKETGATSQSSSRNKRVSCESLDGSNRVGNSIELPLKRVRGNSDGGRHVTETAIVSNEIHVTVKQKKKNWGVESPMCSGGSYNGSQSQPMKSIECHRTNFYNFSSNRKAEAFSVGQVWAIYDRENMPRSYAYISSISNSPFKLYIRSLKPIPVSSDEKKWCDVGLPVACGTFELPVNKITGTAPTTFSHLISRVASISNGQVEIHQKKGDVWAIYRDWKPYDWCSDPGTMKGSELQMVEILTDYMEQLGVRVAKLVKVEGFRSVFQRYTDKGKEIEFQIDAKDSFMFSHNVPAFRFVGGEMDGVSCGMFELDPLAVPSALVQDIAKTVEEESSSNCSSFTNFLPSPSPSILEPEIEILNSRWSAQDFTSGQIWAVYEGPDSFPRRYTIVRDVVSENEVCVTILEPQPLLDDEIYWANENLPFVCGLFKDGRTTLNLRMSKFSHLVNCKQSLKNPFYRIYPKKGEIWAIYKNWNSKWTQSDYSCCQCQVVEIISNLSEKAEIRIANLVEVNGWITFFQRKLCDGFELSRAVSRKEMLSFSHQIPAFTVPGIENRGIPKDSLHLEPNALPPMIIN